MKTLSQLASERAAQAALEAERQAQFIAQCEADKRRQALLNNSAVPPMQGITEAEARAKRARMLAK